MIPITKPFLPSLEQYQAVLARVWQKQWLTNHGPLLVEFEQRLADYLGTVGFQFVANGTVALQVAIKSLGVEGEVITSPFSFVATTNAILAEKCTPVFADIDPLTFNVDPVQVEQSVTEKTTAILIPHIFGQACAIDEILEIAHSHQLKVIFDGAHCFGSSYKGSPVFNYGDVSAISFHATKLFHTVEGGGVFASEQNLLKRCRMFSNFGFDDHPEKFACPGINAKNSEFHAAMGLCMLDYADRLRERRRQQWLRYAEQLHKRWQILHVEDPSGYNYAYFPLLFDCETERERILACLEANNVYTRRYFTPSLATLNYVKQKALPVVDDVVKRIICLPLYYDLSDRDQAHVIETLLEAT